MFQFLVLQIRRCRGILHKLNIYRIHKRRIIMDLSFKIKRITDGRHHLQLSISLLVWKQSEMFLCQQNPSAGQFQEQKRLKTLDLGNNIIPVTWTICWVFHIRKPKTAKRWNPVKNSQDAEFKEYRWSASQNYSDDAARRRKTSELCKNCSFRGIKRRHELH